MYAFLRSQQALAVSRAASPVSDAPSSSTNESEDSAPGSLPLCTPIDLFHQRYPREFWSANTPRLDGHHLVTGPKELEAEADEDVMDYVLTEATEQDARSWCMAALNIADYNSVTGGEVEHPLTAAKDTKCTCFKALTLEMKHIALADREWAEKNAADLRLAQHCSPQALKDVARPVTAFERKRLDTRFEHMGLVFDALELHLTRLESDPTFDADMRRSLVQLRREFGHAHKQGTEELALLDRRIKDVRTAVQRVRKTPTHYPVPMLNVFAPKGSVVNLQSDDDSREMGALYTTFMCELQALRSLYPDYVKDLRCVCEDIQRLLAIGAGRA